MQMVKPKIDVWLELETRCNLRCKFCYNFWRDGSSPAPKRLGTDLMLKSLDALFTVVECGKAAISGGEPLLREDLYEIVSYLNNRKVPMVLTTNGLLLNKDRVEQLKNLGVYTFQIPLHSTKQKVHDELSGLSCWKETLCTILTLKECAVSVIPVFVATRLNLNDFLGVLEVSYELGIREIIFNRFIPGGLGLKYHWALGVPTDEEILQVLLAANKRAKELDILIHLGVPVRIPYEIQISLDHVTISSCPVGLAQTVWVVDCEGNLRRCNHSGEVFGNLLYDGANKLAEELQKKITADPMRQDIKHCKFLNHSELVQISASARECL